MKKLLLIGLALFGIVNCLSMDKPSQSQFPSFEALTKAYKNHLLQLAKLAGQDPESIQAFTSQGTINTNLESYLLLRIFQRIKKNDLKLEIGQTAREIVEAFPHNKMPTTTENLDPNFYSNLFFNPSMYQDESEEDKKIMIARIKEPLSLKAPQENWIQYFMNLLFSTDKQDQKT